MMTQPHARAEDDKANLDDLKEVERAMIEARQALIKAMAGLGRHERETFIFHVGFARERLARVSSRIYGEPVSDIEMEKRA